MRNTPSAAASTSGIRLAGRRIVSGNYQRDVSNLPARGADVCSRPSCTHAKEERPDHGELPVAFVRSVHSQLASIHACDRDSSLSGLLARPFVQRAERLRWPQRSR